VAEQGKVDPMHQFSIEPLFGTDHWSIAGHNIAFTNSALWMLITFVVLFILWRAAPRAAVPGRWQVAVEGLVGFIDNLLAANVGPKGKKYVPYIFSLFASFFFQPAGPAAAGPDRAFIPSPRPATLR
jgi:F-type H+-transporting ATPase subunit a